MTHTTPGIHKFKDFVAQQAVQTPCSCCFDTHVIPNDDNKALLQPPDPIQPQTQEIQPQFPLPTNRASNNDTRTREKHPYNDHPSRLYTSPTTR